MLCGAGHPAFADGSIPSEGQILAFLIKMGFLAGLAILALVLVIKGLSRASNAAVRRRRARAAAPEIPAARVVESADSDRRQG